MKLRRNVSLAGLTALRAGGPARYFTEVKTKGELKEAISTARGKKLPFFVLGGGSNVLFRDEGFPGLVVKMGFKGIEFKKGKRGKTLAIVGAGENWDGFVSKTVSKRLHGLENLSGIPGTVGASPIQNIGAYGAEAKDSILWVEVFDAKREKFFRLKNKKCLFGYRDSVFKKPAGRDYIVTGAAYLLSRGGRPNLKYKDLSECFPDAERFSPSPAAIRRAVLEIRRRKLPDWKKLGTAGSFFKNPVVSGRRFAALKKKYPAMQGFAEGRGMKVSLAWILDKVLNLNGLKLGKAGLFRRQPLVLVNCGGAKSEEIRKLAETVRKKVFSKTKIKIEFEVKVL